MANIYESIAERTQGDIYLGVVGPVRTGKSTFIKRFMDLLVLPNVTDIYVKQRIEDELPQSGTGKTITTTEPKFIPAEAAPVNLSDGVNFKVRVADCVGYMIPGAIGHIEEGRERMVATPWSEEKLAFCKAAEIGTHKVITEHSTIGIIVTSDGTITDLPRESYEEAEDRVIKEMKEMGKPFVVVLNSIKPDSDTALGIMQKISQKHQIPVVPADCKKMSVETLNSILEEALYQFPVSQINFALPGFTGGLEKEHWIKIGLINGIKDWAKTFENMEDIKETSMLVDGEVVTSAEIVNIDLATGIVDIKINMAEGLFYQVVEELMGHEVKNDYQFFGLIREFAAAKKSYDKLSEAMMQVEQTGYGIVQPRLSEMVLEEPEIFRQGNKYGVRLKAKAPSMHIIRTDITTEVSPVVGTEKQSEDLIKHLLKEFENEPEKIWDTNLFGKSLSEMVTEQMETKLASVPEGVRVKVQRSLQKISDEGKDYFICIVF
ncbi:MAG: stage IV sporulation protein A [Eubacteriales bacterium]|nr:stage IV sporulation protein A [Eubacteriales bacterium]MDD4389175.1 stage IV sporulation protein A [Eubacteriales bacterium]